MKHIMHLLARMTAALVVSQAIGADGPMWAARVESNGVGLSVHISGMESDSWNDLMIDMSITNLREEELVINWPYYGGWERLNLFSPDGKRVPPTPSWAESMGEVTRYSEWTGRQGTALGKGQARKGRLPIAKLFQTDNPGGHVLKVGWVQGERRGVPYPVDPNLRIEVRLPGKLPAKPEDFTLVFPTAASAPNVPSQSAQEPPPSASAPLGTSFFPWLLGGSAVALAGGLFWFWRRKAG